MAGTAVKAPGGALTAHEGVPRRQSAREPSARTYARSLPIVPVRARGLTIEGADGRRYLDCLSGAGTLALGHHHPVVLEAIRRVLDSGAPLHVPDVATPVEEAFVAELVRNLPPGLARHARVRFCGPSRTDALDAAVRLAGAATGRSRVPAVTGTHPGAPGAGRTGRTGRPTYAGGRPLPFEVGVDGHEDRHEDEYADEGELDAGRAGSGLAGPRPGAQPPAGVLVEPVRGDGGAPHLSDTWLRRLRHFTAARSLPLVLDESATGMGRTGAFWGVEHSGITPDAMVFSEAIGGGLPLAVVVHRDDLGAWDPDTLDRAFRGNQLAMAAGRATLAHIRENRLVEHAARLGSRMLAQLRDVSARLGCVGDVRGRGLMIGIEMTDPTGESTAAARARRPRELAASVRSECLRRGLIVDVGGRHGNVVRLLPPLTISEEQASAVLDRLADAVRAVARALPDGERT
ncbi:aminotransferase class III-fold pyridoxal phosphate-dependent enzyme [Streptomyces sp. HMX87]|uniref:aminotransferase class III-fold pyridoxal phosphate-dependent enzyme n=1 Tax=Streptomyces sp. HMX87 TaxID=3390849 RepID=UPI003A8C686E